MGKNSISRESQFLYHAPCPKCGSRDNVAMYDDGHGWCFGCRAIVIKPPIIKYQERKVVDTENVEADRPTVVLPDDYTVDIPQQGLEWLLKYINPAEIREHRLGWSQNGWKIRKGRLSYSPLLILPVFSPSQNLEMYQARYFGSLKLPKYWTVGDKSKILHLLHPRKSQDSLVTAVCLTEDLLSAIKVSRIVTAIPIWGSEVSNELAIQLHNRFHKLFLWLDADKRRYARDRAQSLRYLFDEVSVIETDADPKDYSTEEIRRFINASQ